MSGKSSRFIAAAARFRIVPPMPTSRPPPLHQPSSSSLAAACTRSSFICFGSPSRPAGSARSLHGAEPEERESASRRPSIFSVWMLPPPMSSPKPSSIVVELAIASQP